METNSLSLVYEGALRPAVCSLVWSSCASNRRRGQQRGFITDRLSVCLTGKNRTVWYLLLTGSLLTGVIVLAVVLKKKTAKMFLTDRLSVCW